MKINTCLLPIHFIFLTWTVTSVCAKIDLNNPIAREIFHRSKGSDIKSWMEPDEDPCANFYKYACGKWQRVNSATGTNVYSTDQFQEASKGQQRKVNDLLTKAKSGDLIEDKLRDFYESCRYIKNNTNEYKHNLQMFYKKYGQFSFMRSENDETSPAVSNWWTMVANIHKKYGKASILALQFRADVKNKSHNVLYLCTPDFSMNQPGISTKIAKYLKLYFGISEEKAKQVAEDLVDFEIFLIEGATDERSDKTVDDLLTLYNTTDLIEKYMDLMDMEMFLKTALNSSQLPEQLYVYDESYLEYLIDVMDSTDPQMVHDYILWNLLEEYMVDAKDDRWDDWCSGKTKKYFGKFIDHAMYKQYRSEEYEKEIYKLWEEIKSAFCENLNGNNYEWMSVEVREHAVQKLDNMKLTINSYNDEDFETFFQDLAIDPSNYVGNIQNTLELTERQRGSKLQKQHNGIDDAEVLSFTPVYNTFENEIMIPVAMLQPYRLWHPLYPNAIKYSTLGFLLAHEMIHGFDDGGRLFDANGHTHNWWDEQSVEEFNKRCRCFQNQYHNYIYDGVPLESSVSQSENIADNAAVKLAYQAYATWLNKTEKSGQTAGESFRNLSYSNREIFFLTMAQLWCEDVHADYRTELAIQDAHAPAMYRVIGTLSNFDEFSEIFQCKPGSVMNPLEKCAIY